MPHVGRFAQVVAIVGLGVACVLSLPVPSDPRSAPSGQRGADMGCWLRVFIPLVPIVFPTAVFAAVFTVGAGGSHPTLQAAVDAAVLSPGSDSIRLRSGTLTGSTVLTGNLAGNDLELSGGWDAGFSVQGSGATQLDGANAGTVLRLSVSAGQVQLRDLTLQHGLAGGQPAGLDLQAAGTASITLERVSVQQSRTQDSGAACAGISAGDDSVVQWSAGLLDDCRNEHPSVAAGAGLRVLAQERARVEVSGIEVRAARAVAGQTYGTAVYVDAQGLGRVRLESLRIQDAAAQGSTVFGSGLALSATDSGEIVATALELNDNQAPAGAASTAQLAISASAFAVVQIGSTLLRSGPQQGLAASAIGASVSVHLRNLTVVGHAGRGLQFFGSGPVTLHNTIVQGNGLPSALPTGTSSQNLGADLGLPAPVFQSSASGNYRLAAGSPGFDAGLATPPGGLPAIDLDRRVRTLGPAPDIGAYEQPVDVVLRDGFE